MSTAQVIALSLFGSGLIGWIVSLEIRLRNTQAKLVISEQKVTDANIVQQIHNFTDAALKLTLEADLGAGPESKSGNDSSTKLISDLPKS